MLGPLLAATLGTVGRESQVINASSTDPHMLPSHQRSRKERLPGSESQRASSPAPRAPSTPALRVHTSAAQPTRERPASGVTPTAGPHSYQVKLQPIPSGCAAPGAGLPEEELYDLLLETLVPPGKAVTRPEQAVSTTPSTDY